jgi:hypothetical protein
MRAKRLSSSAIERVAYDDEEHTLTIWFRQTGRYIYHDVPRAIYDTIASAPSAGRYFGEAIKGRYRCTFDPARRRFRPLS